MNILAIIILIALVGTLNVVCFFVGAKVGNAVAKDEPIKAPTINPMEIIRESQDKKEARREQDYYDTIMSNIENYNGTSIGQKDVPTF